MTLTWKPRRDASRRDVITARFARGGAHIASLLVQARPERLATAVPALNRLRGVEVHRSDPRGKVVVTVEAPSDRRLLAAIAEIEAVPGVVTANLVYHEIEGADHG